MSVQLCFNFNRTHESVGKALKTANQDHVTANSHELSLLFHSAIRHDSWSQDSKRVLIHKPTKLTRTSLLESVFYTSVKSCLHYMPWPSLGQAKVNVARLHHYIIFLRLAHFGLEFCN